MPELRLVSSFSAGSLLIRPDLGGGHALDHLDLAGGQRADPDRGLLEEPVGHLVEVRRPWWPALAGAQL